ncbi:MAG: class I SAM-dependent methyltransferase [Calditrichaeota bacterium]|nr:MAG: class I SAM-dependent methyltransferase [Calditrichota bacterium]
MKFSDHFSRQSASYKNYRPDYPAALFTFLAEQAPSRNLAWDCATGNGQSALGLAPYFTSIIATDASSNQINNAVKLENIKYVVANAEKTILQDGSVDLITVAQAFHWFNSAKFYAEAKRVLKNRGIIAIWSYNLISISPNLDTVIADFYSTTLHGFWPEERQLVENNYQGISFPFRQITVPEFQMRAQWSFDHLIGYMGTWSAVQKYIKTNGIDPVAGCRAKLQAEWGDLTLVKDVSWPLTLIVGEHNF